MIELPTNGHIFVTNDIDYKDKCTEDRIYANSDSILRLKENDRIFLDYGKIELVVERVGKLKHEMGGHQLHICIKDCNRVTFVNCGDLCVT